MESFKGYYYINEEDQTPATLWLEKDRIRISISNELKEERIIFWPYELLVIERFWKEGKVMVRTQGYPQQFIEVPSKAFGEELKQHLHNRNSTWAKRTVRSKPMGLIRILLIFLALLIGAYLWLVPFLADRMARRVPVSYEESLGDALFNSMKGAFKIDEKKTLYINEMFRELKLPTKYNIRITVVKSNISNAFAMPGGNIVVYDKLIAQIKNYEDLVALLSHEFTHVDKKHSTRTLFRRLGSAIFLSVLVGDVGAITGVMLRNADNLKSQHYSRSLEKEADQNGLRILSERKIDCNGFIRLFEQLQKELSSSEVSRPEWADSHPNLEKRIKYIRDDKHFNANGVEVNESLKTLFLKMKTE